MISNQNISARTYEVLHAAYDEINTNLLEGKLPPVMLTLTRKRGAHGFFHAEQFRLRGEDEEGEGGLHEVALNPQTMGRSAREVLSTLAHEAVHVWDQEFGEVPASGHGKTWANKMDEIGLTPTSTGQPGGKRTGRKVTHMIVEGGPFDAWCADFLQRNPDAIGIFAVTKAAGERKKDLSKVKFTCGCCNANAWAKHTMRIICADCDEEMVSELAEKDDD